MQEIKTIKFSAGKKGVNDLLCEYAFFGNSQGDESVSNDIEVYKSQDGWMSYAWWNKIPMEQEAINKEVERIKKHNAEYIQKCKDDGTYGQELNPIIFRLTPAYFPKISSCGPTAV